MMMSTLALLVFVSYSLNEVFPILLGQFPLPFHIDGFGCLDDNHGSSMLVHPVSVAQLGNRSAAAG